MIVNCEYGDLMDSMLRDSIVIGIRSDEIRESLLTEMDLSLDKCINIVKSHELAKTRMRKLEEPDDRKNSLPMRRNEARFKQAENLSNRNGHQRQRIEENQINNINGNFPKQIFVNIMIQNR